MSEQYNVYSTKDIADFDSDIQLSEDEYGGDLVVDEAGDLNTVAGWQNLHQAIRRRLGTIKGYLAAFVRDTEGLIQVDEAYGNPAYQYLSEPLDNNTLAGLRLGVQQCMQDEDRIEVSEVRVSLVPVNSFIRVMIDIDYNEASEANRSIRLLQTERGLEVI